MSLTSFKTFLTELDNSYVVAQSGVDSRGLDNKVNRDLLNSRLSLACKDGFFTPYMGWGAIAKTLAYAGIVIPQYIMLDREKGGIVIKVDHFGKPFGPDIMQNYRAPKVEGNDWYVLITWEMNERGCYDMAARIMDGQAVEDFLGSEGFDTDDGVNGTGSTANKAPFPGSMTMLKAKEPVNESVEELNELSKNTLGSYVKKASDYISHQDWNAGFDAAHDKSLLKNPSKIIHGHDHKKVVKHIKGLNKAVDKLTKEESIQEDRGDRYVATHQNGHYHARVIYNSGHGHRVEYYNKGKHVGDSYHDSEDDAHDTANYHVNTGLSNLIEEPVNETLSSKASIADWIHDFVHSKNPKFDGKDKKERIKMALGAYYAKHSK